MARTVDLFLDSQLPLEVLAAELSELSGTVFTPVAGTGTYLAHYGGVVTHLAGHDFVDDDGLPLSEFRYVLSATVPHGAELETSAELAALRAVSASLRHHSSWPCLLVIDLERPDAEEAPAPGPAEL